MRVPITYVASSGNTYNLISNGIKHRDANYYNWTWEVEGTKLQYGYRVADFSRDVAVYDTELIFYGSERRRRALIQNLHDDFENDVRTKRAGRIIWGDYYLECFITESSTEPTDVGTWTSNKISIYAPYPFWVQDFHVSLPSSSESSSGFLEYPFDYMYDYTSPAMGTRHIQTNFPFESDFEMTIFGQAVNPRVVINGYAYALNTTIPEGAYVIINSRQKTIMMYQNGVRTNMFNFRNKTDSVFQKITGGDLTISWDSEYGVDLTIYHERSEPRVEVTNG